MRIHLLAFIIVILNNTGCSGQQPASADTAHLNIYHSITDSARMYGNQKDTGKALQYHKRALLHAHRHGLQEHEARSLVHIAMLLKGQDTSQSFSYLNRALIIAERLNKQELRADILMAISSVYKQRQNYQEALSALEAHEKLLQSVFEHHKQQETNRLLAEERVARERAILITISIALALLTLVFWFYYSRIRRLNKALSKSNRIKDTLFSIIGHDLRGPAGGIMQALDMVDAGVLDQQEEKQVIGLLKEQSRSFNETLNSLLTWASAQLKGAQPHVASIDAMTAIQRSLDLLKAQAAAKHIEVKAPGKKELAVLADSDQLDFVVRNLLSNAIKFSYPGGRIDITAEKKEDTAVIAVHDDGKGIPAEKQKELFEEGRLTSTFGTKGEKGTGLGLMLTWDFIKANRGRIWFDSKEGAGTTFYISLPLAV